MNLARYACDPAGSRGRRFAETAPFNRTEFQRDRDRIVHSTAFRRLVYKTQVFLNHEGDLFRTRLTHSLEVAQLGRSIARSLRLNEDLVEAIALAHDLGHTPFGHAGQDALNQCMHDAGGFEHNLQSLRVVDQLEERYPEFDGLNLSYETREGILKHCARSHAQQMESDEPGGVWSRFIVGAQPSLEAQLCNLADEIAYNAHDVDDGVRSGLISLEQLQELPLVQEFQAQALADHPQLGQPSQARRLLYQTIRLMLSAQVLDVIDATQTAIDASPPTNVDDVRQRPPLVQFAAPMRERSLALKAFLMKRLYRHPKVMENMALAQRVVHDLFEAYCDRPQEMQPGFAARAMGVQDGEVLATFLLKRVVADYIAGMTDRFAAREHQRLTGRNLLV